MLNCFIYISYFIMIGLRVEVYVYGNNFIDEKEKPVYTITSIVLLSHNVKNMVMLQIQMIFTCVSFFSLQD